MTSCEWAKIRPAITLRSPFSTFFYDENITKQKILADIMKDNFYGIISVSLHASEAGKKDWARINWPPLFCKTQVELKDLSPEMQKFYIDYNTKPRLEPGL